MGLAQFVSQSRRLLPAIVTALAMAFGHAARATDYGATTSGPWGNALTWTPSSAFPGSSDNAYIGSNHPAGAVAAASVTLGGSQSVSNLYVGYGAAANSGTLDLAGNHLTVNSGLNFGQSGGTGTLVHNGGYFSTPNLNLYSGNSIVLAASDTVTTALTLSNSSQLTTSAAANVPSSVNLFSGSTLTLGASMSLSGNLDMRDNYSTLNMAGHPLSASTIYLGWYDGQPVTVLNRGPITTASLSVGNGGFNLGSSDTVTNLNLSSGGTTATATPSNVSASVQLFSGSTLALGASMTLSGNLDARDSGTVFDMAGHPLSASTVYLGWYDGQPVTVLNRGPITTPTLDVGYISLNLTPSDAVTNFGVQGGTTALGSGVTVSALNLAASAQATTSTVGNVSTSVQLFSGSMLTLGNSMTLSGNFDARDKYSTLDMAGHPLSAPTIYLGWYDGQPITVLNRGPITAANLNIGNGSFSLSSSDTVTNLNLSSSGTSATATPSNVSTSVQLFDGSTMSLGASMSLSGNFDARDSGTVFDMAGHPLSAATVLFGWYDGHPVTVLNRGTITTPNFDVGYISLNLTPSDSVTNFSVEGGTTTLGSGVTVSTLNLTASAQATTSTVGNVSTSVQLFSGSMLTLGTSMTLSGNFDARDAASVFNMAGHPLSAPTIYLGWYDNQPVTVLNRGPITATNLNVGNITLNLTPSDAVTNFNLAAGTTTLGSGATVSTLNLSSSAQATTSTVGNVSTSIQVFGGSMLTLGTSMTLSGNFDVRDSLSTLNMGGHPLSAGGVYLGWSDAKPVTVLNRGPIATPGLYVGYSTFNLIPADAVTSFNLEGGTSTLNSPVSSLNLTSSAQAATTASGNVSGNMQVFGGSALTLGTSMTLSGNFDERDNYSTFNMAGHPLSASTIYLGWFDGQPVNVVNPGAVTANSLYVSGGSALPLSAQNSVVNSLITISNNSVLTLQQPSGQLTGLTFHGSTSAALSVNDTSVLKLTGGSNSGPSWLFRWQDPAAGTWVNSLSSQITAGRIAVSSSTGYSLFDDEGYTYIAAPTTLFWNGGGGDNNWSTSGNWSGTTATAGHWLRFGALAGGGQTANNNDLAANSLFYGIFFDAAAPSYNLQGNAIQLSGDVLNQSGTNQSIGLNIQLVPGDGAFNTNTITFDTGAKNITDSCSISGSGMALKKTGTGTLILSGTNSYDSGTIVTAGKLIATTPYAILDGTSLTVGANAQAKFAAPIDGAAAVSDESAPMPVPEPGALALAAVLLAGAAAHRIAHSRRARQAF